jgi:hypothetical protein
MTSTIIKVISWRPNRLDFSRLSDHRFDSRAAPDAKRLLGHRVHCRSERAGTLAGRFRFLPVGP